MMGSVQRPFFTFKVFRLFKGFTRIWDKNPILKLHARQVCFYYTKQMFTLIKDTDQNDFSKRKTILLIGLKNRVGQYL